MAKIKFYPFSKETQAMAPEPTPASKNIPEWYKKQPAYGTSDEEQMLKSGLSGSTVKRCMPIFDIINTGYIIYIPCDIYIDATDPNKLKWSIPSFASQVKRELVSSHAPEQVSHYPLNEKQYHKEIFRIMPFWSVGTEKGYSTLFTHPFHSDQLPFRTFGAVVDTDKFITDGHFSIQLEKGFKGVLERGTPLVQVIPFKRDSYSMELVDVEKSNKILLAQRLLIRSKFKNFYRNHLRVPKDYK